MSNSSTTSFRFCPKRKCTLKVTLHSGTIHDDNTADLSYYNGNNKVLDNLLITLDSREHPQDTMHRVKMTFPGPVETGDTKEFHLDSLTYENGQKCHDPFLYRNFVSSVVITYTDGVSITFDGNMLEDSRLAAEEAERERREKERCSCENRSKCLLVIIIVLALIIVGLLVYLNQRA